MRREKIVERGWRKGKNKGTDERREGGGRRLAGWRSSTIIALNK